LRARFTGKPEMVMNYFTAMATEIRDLVRRLGASSIAELVGRVQFLEPRHAESAAWVEGLLKQPARARENPKLERKGEGLSQRLVRLLDIKSGARPAFLEIANADRSIGAELSGELLRRYGSAVALSAPWRVNFRGVAGQSFGAFLAQPLEFHLSGEANDYVGKGLSGGVIAIDSGPQASVRGDVLAGNTVLYGATSGELYLAGRAGERFAVRNSGAVAVVEGVGDHGCEYMTGGVVLVPGPTGINFGSGMTGGLAYVLAEHAGERTLNSEFVFTQPCSDQEDAALRQLLIRHCLHTASPRAAFILNSVGPLPFVRVQPVHLPCSVEQTWKPVLERLNAPASFSLHAAAQTLSRPGAIFPDSGSSGQHLRAL
jgi:glutamate synthase domain-containing protein 3